MGRIVIIDVVLNFMELNVIHCWPVEETIVETDLFARGELVADTRTQLPGKAAFGAVETYNARISDTAGSEARSFARQSN